MPVGRDESQVFRLQVEIDTVHDRAQLVVGGSEQRTADATQQQLGVDIEFHGAFLERFFQRISRSLHADEIILSILEMDECRT